MRPSLRRPTRGRRGIIAGGLLAMGVLAASACAGDDGDATRPTVIPASTASTASTAPSTASTAPTTASTRPPTTSTTATSSTTTAPSTTAAPTTTAAPLDQAIRTVDFRNGFTYSVPGYPVFTVSGGQAVHGAIGEPEFSSFTVTDVDHGDLDGDGREEAAVSVELFTGGTGHFTNVWVYRLTASSTSQAAQTPVGDRGDGGLADTSVTGGALVVDTYDHAEGACCPRAVTRRQYRLAGDALVETSTPTTSALVDLSPQGATVQFLVGTSSAVLRASLESPAAGGFEAGAGQRLQASRRTGPGVTLTLRQGGAGGPIVTQGASIDATLAAPGDYRLEVTASPPMGSALVDLSIT